MKEQLFEKEHRLIREYLDALKIDNLPFIAPGVIETEGMTSEQRVEYLQEKLKDLQRPIRMRDIVQFPELNIEEGKSVRIGG